MGPSSASGTSHSLDRCKDIRLEPITPGFHELKQFLSHGWRPKSLQVFCQTVNGILVKTHVVGNLVSHFYELVNFLHDFES
jgi:hypothetical protein